MVDLLPMRTAIYARVSTIDQKCEMQLRELRQYVSARGWDTYKEYVDEGYSGKNAKRPAIIQCMKDAKARKIDVIVVWKFDRWGRTVAQLNGDIQELDLAGVRFISLTDGIDTDKASPISTLLRHLMAAFAQFERDLIKERTSVGFQQYKADYEEGKKPSSNSGKNLPIGRPKIIFNRDHVKALRSEGKSWSEITLITGLAITTARRFVND